MLSLIISSVIVIVVGGLFTYYVTHPKGKEKNHKHT
jgi:Sec-independent protein secretion pathway component TatC